VTTTEGPSGPPVTEGRGNLSRAVLAVHVVCIIPSWDGCRGRRAVGAVKTFKYFSYGPFYVGSSSKTRVIKAGGGASGIVSW